MERPKLSQVHEEVKSIFNDYKSRQLDILGNFVNALGQKSDEHQDKLKRVYKTARLNRNMASFRLNKKYPDGPPQEEIDLMEDKYRRAYLSSVVQENQNFSEWLYRYQTDNMIKSRDSLNQIITEMQDHTKRRKIIYEPVGSFQDVPAGSVDPPPLDATKTKSIDLFKDVDMDSFATAPIQERDRKSSFDEFVEGYEMYDKMYWNNYENYIPPSNQM